MDRELLARWRGAVPAGDTLICLGDVAHLDAWRGPHFEQELGTWPGERVLILGNHDLELPAPAGRGRLRAAARGRRPRYQPGPRPHACCRCAACPDAPSTSTAIFTTSRRLPAVTATCRSSARGTRPLRLDDLIGTAYGGR